jgi:diacylglycerol kinase family enzyme
VNDAGSIYRWKKIMPGTRFTADMHEPQSRSGKSYASLTHFLQVHRAVRIGMLNNPLSGGNRNGLQKIRDAASAIRPEVLQREVQTPSDVAATLAEFARQEVNILVVNGGDGTVQAALTAIFHKKFFKRMPVLAVLRSAGTTSMIAGDVGLKGPRESALRRLFKWTRTKDPSATFLQRSVLRVQVPPEKEPVYGMFFGAAAIFQATHFCHQKIHARGVRGEKAAGAALARFLVAVLLRDRKVISAVPITTRVDQKSVGQQNYLLVLVTTLQRLFLGLRPYWGSEPRPLHYTAVGARPRHFLRSLPSLMRGRQGRYITPDNGYISHNIDEVQLSLKSGFNLDGELYTPDSTLGPVVVAHGGQALFLQL